MWHYALDILSKLLMHWPHMALALYVLSLLLMSLHVLSSMLLMHWWGIGLLLMSLYVLIMFTDVLSSSTGGSAPSVRAARRGSPPRTWCGGRAARCSTWSASRAWCAGSSWARVRSCTCWTRTGSSAKRTTCRAGRRTVSTILSWWQGRFWAMVTTVPLIINLWQPNYSKILWQANFGHKFTTVQFLKTLTTTLPNSLEH